MDSVHDRPGFEDPVILLFFVAIANIVILNLSPRVLL